MKENFQIHIWLGLLLCLLGMSCSDDTPAKGNEPGNGNTELEVNEWIESVMRSDYLWNNDIPAQDKLDFSADPQTFFSSMLSLKDGKTRNGKHLYYYSYMEKNKDYKARTSIDADDTYGMEFTLGNYISLCTRFLLKSRVEVQISTLDFTHKDTNKLFEINRFGIFYLGVSL